MQKEQTYRIFAVLNSLVFAFTAVAPLAVVLTVLLSVAWNDEPAKTGESESHKRSAAGCRGTSPQQRKNRYRKHEEADEPTKEEGSESHQHSAAEEPVIKEENESYKRSAAVSRETNPQQREHGGWSHMKAGIIVMLI
nr:uncharacterized protein LOC131769465 [Pocillopora verrucosa]